MSDNPAATLQRLEAAMRRHGVRGDTRDDWRRLAIGLFGELSSLEEAQPKTRGQGRKSEFMQERRRLHRFMSRERSQRALLFGTRETDRAMWRRLLDANPKFDTGIDEVDDPKAFETLGKEKIKLDLDKDEGCGTKETCNLIHETELLEDFYSLASAIAKSFAKKRAVSAIENFKFARVCKGADGLPVLPSEPAALEYLRGSYVLQDTDLEGEPRAFWAPYVAASERWSRADGNIIVLVSDSPGSVIHETPFDHLIRSGVIEKLKSESDADREYLAALDGVPLPQSDRNSYSEN